MPKKIQPGDLVVLWPHATRGPYAQFWEVIEKTRMYAMGGREGESVYDIRLLECRSIKSPPSRTVNGGEIEHVCAHCKMTKKSHAAQGKCLYHPTSWKRYTVKDFYKETP